MERRELQRERESSGGQGSLSVSTPLRNDQPIHGRKLPKVRAGIIQKDERARCF